MTDSANKRMVKRIAVLLIAVGASIGAISFLLKSAVEVQDIGTIDPSQDEQYRELVVGTWEDNFKGHRTLTVRGDGTATMVVEPDGLNAWYSARLRFEEEWMIEEGQLRLKAVGGEPKSRVALILKSMGNESNQMILELTTERLLLLDADGITQYNWRRIEEKVH